MKHNLRVTVTLVVFFFLAQIIGLVIINQYIDHAKSEEAQEIVMKELPYGIERPQVENKSTSFIYIMISILLGTLLFLLLIKFNKLVIWKVWFFIAVSIMLSIAFSAFINPYIAVFIALILGLLKMFRPNLIIQNISELFIYGGLASIFVPILNIPAAFMLLVAISIYDFIAVYKTKHMVKMAKFQSSSNVFAGLLIPYEKEKISIYQGKAQIGNQGKGSKIAVLGGGDIGFTLIFAGVVMQSLMLKNPLHIGFMKTLIIPVCVSIALLALLLKGEKNKFYPAMPVLSLGCLAGYFVILLINLL